MKAFTMHLQGNLNNVAFTIDGAGNRNPEHGVVQGRYNLTRADGSRMEISNLDHWIFNCMIITGYPSETAGSDDTENPFKERPYRYRRNVDFLERGAIELEVDVNFTNKGLLESRFKANGRVHTPPIEAVEPTIETWVPLNEKQILGTFTMSWLSREGDRIPGIATTFYELLDTGPSLLSTRHRRVEISASGTLWQFTRRQRSTLIPKWSGPVGVHLGR